MTSAHLAVRELSVDLASTAGWRSVVTGVTFDIDPGSAVALLGRSGSGKTLTALAILDLLPTSSMRVTGAVELGGEDLLSGDTAPPPVWRGRRIGMIFQEPTAALNPVLTVGQQITEGLRRHRSMGRREAKREAERLLDLVALPGGAQRLDDYPYQLSGGQRQRVMIAAALAPGPEILIADEPTTALDVTVQAQILQLLSEIRNTLGLSLLLISHDLAVVAQTCERAVILDQGRVVEQGSFRHLFDHPQHPITRRLIEISKGFYDPAELRSASSGPDGNPPAKIESVDGEPLVEIGNLGKRFPTRLHPLGRRGADAVALESVDLTLMRSECLAVVGESGSGKTTLGHCVLHLTPVTGGRILIDGRDLQTSKPAELRRQRRDFQMIFQDPGSALDPRIAIGRALAEPLEIHTSLGAKQRGERVRELLQMVDLPVEIAQRLPHQLSTGQKQRVGIARALATEPRLLIADEPFSALDLGVRADIIELLMRLRRQLQLTILLISHDLAVVRRLADRIAVLYCGRVVELAPTWQLFERPQHPYTGMLLASMPDVDRGPVNRYAPIGEPPDPRALPLGCRFHPRCPIAEDRCRREDPALVDSPTGCRVACFRPGELETRLPTDPPDGTF